MIKSGKKATGAVARTGTTLKERDINSIEIESDFEQELNADTLTEEDKMTMKINKWN